MKRAQKIRYPSRWDVDSFLFGIRVLTSTSRDYHPNGHRVDSVDRRKDHVISVDALTGTLRAKLTLSVQYSTYVIIEWKFDLRQVVVS